MTDRSGEAPPGAEEKEQWQMDRVESLLGRYLAEKEIPQGHDDPRFLAWLSEEMRARQALTGGISAERLRAARERILREAAALRASVLLVTGPVPLRDREVRGVFAEELAQAGTERCGVMLPLSVAAGGGRELWEEECDQWVTLPRDVPDGRYVALAVTGESMTPLLHPGDVVLVRMGPTVTPDSVVVARHPDDGYVVKRVGAVRARELELLSLNPEFAPVRVPRDEQSILGTVVLRWCEHGAPASE